MDVGYRKKIRVLSLQCESFSQLTIEEWLKEIDWEKEFEVFD